MTNEREAAIYIDADACPVKEQVYRVAMRYDVPVWVVANSPMRIPVQTGLRARMVVVPDSPDAADAWIADHVSPGDLVLTADIPLAAQTVEIGIRTLDFRGKEFRPASIGNALAARDVNALLRSMGEVTRGPAPVTNKDRGRFASLLDTVVSAMARDRGQASN